MSRFGLRSHTDATPKEYEDDEHTTTTTKTTTTTTHTTKTASNSSQTTIANKSTKTAHRRVYSKKKKKISESCSSSTLPTQNKNDKNLKLGTETTTAIKTAVTTTAAVFASASSSLTSVNASETVTNPISLMCRLPLTRLSGFIDKLQLPKHAKNKATKYLSQQKQQQKEKNSLFDSLKLTTDDVRTTAKPPTKPLSKQITTTTTTTTIAATKNEKELNREGKVKEEEKDDKEEKRKVERKSDRKIEEEKEDLQQQQQPQKQEKSTNINDDQQQQQTSIVGKLMCLYCDKKFISTKMQVKHVEKFHIQTRDRRSSVRNLNEQIPTTTTSTSNINRRQQQQHTYPSCNYCMKRNGGANNILIVDEITTNEQLNALFRHLIECHADKYYGCKLCSLRFPNINKLQKHKQLMHSTTTLSSSSTTTTITTTMLPYQQETQQPCADDEDDDDDDTDSVVTTTTTNSSNSSNNNNNNEIVLPVQQQQQQQPITTKRSLRLLQQQHSLDNSNSTDTCNSVPLPEEPTILSRLGLAQNRLPTKRKSGMRLRRDLVVTPTPSIITTTTTKTSSLSSSTTTNTNSLITILPDKLRSGRVTSNININVASTLCATTMTTVTTVIPTTSSGGRASQASNSSGGSSTCTNVTMLHRNESPSRENLFRMPTSYVIDDDFYKEVVNNVRHNLLYYLDGKLTDTSASSSNNNNNNNNNNKSIILNNMKEEELTVRSTLLRSPFILNNSNAITAEEGIDEVDNTELHAASLLNAITAFPTLLTAEQYGGDGFSKMRRAHTKHSWKWKWDSAKKYKLINEGGKMVKKMKPLLGVRDLSKLDMWTQLSMRNKFEMQQRQQQMDVPNEARLERLRLNDQLNLILDQRLLPQISLEQNEQTIIKVEEREHIEASSVQMQKLESHTLMDDKFLAVLQLRATHARIESTQPRLVLSGEWARPRSYMCMLCGAKFDKLKSLEEHKMFRHPHIYCTHYEVVGRELLAKNLLQHLFLPKHALARYNANVPNNNERISNCENSLLTAVEDESSDSLQSTTTIQTTNTPQQLSQIVSPTHSLHSCSSGNSFTRQVLSPVTTPTTPTALRIPGKIFNHNNNNNVHSNSSNSDVSSMRNCTKCQRKCSGSMDLYRHMLDCSGDYIWSMVKKRKYRYYCGSKKRRPCNKYLRAELRKTPKQQQPPKTPDIMTQTKSTSNQPTPRQRPSDAESIKKMLENLPAKRVCKQIFPVDIKKRKIGNKTIKQQKFQRRKLLAKHKNRFKSNVVRQTRSRHQQIMQAGKILHSKINKNKIQKITKNVVVKMVKQSQRNLRLRNLHKQKEKKKSKEQQNKKSNTIATTMSTSKKIGSEEPRCRSLTPKEEQQQQQSHDMKNKTTIEKKDTTLSSLLPTTTTTAATTTNSVSNAINVNPNKIFINSTASIASTITTTVTSSIPTVMSTMHEAFEYANSNASSTSTCTTNTLNSAASMPAITFGATNTRKRSKRINDCIAMLTGKLEEKLQTEQHPASTSIQTRSVAANSIVASISSAPKNIILTDKQITPTKPAQQENQEIQIESENSSKLEKLVEKTITTTTNITSIKTQPPPKTPKRKAPSRRIYKTPSVENIVAHIQPIITKTTTLSTTTSTTTLTLFSTPQMQTIASTTITTPIKSTIVVASSLMTPTTSTLPSLPLPTSLSAHFLKPDTNIPVISVTAIPPILDATHLNMSMLHKLSPHFPIVSMNNLSLLPNLPHTIANMSSSSSNNNKNKTATTFTVAATATPLTSVDNKNTHKSQLKVKSKPLPMSIAATLPSIVMPTMQINMPLPLIQSTHNNNYEEPLNLSSTAKKDSTYSDQRSLDLLPAAYRSNFCGIDMTQHMFHNEDMGPLDLSVKSNKNVSSLSAQEINANSITNLMPLALTVTTTSISTSSQPLALTVNSQQYSASKTLSTSAAMFINECNKHFYSNLDLLKIPQVRTQLAAAGVIPATTTTLNNAFLNSTSTAVATATTGTGTAATTFNSNLFNNIDGNIISGSSGVAISGQMLQGATKATMVVAPIVKKRGNNRQQQQQQHQSQNMIDTYTTTTTTNTAMSTTTTTPTKHIIKLYPNAGGGRGKSAHALTMNEEIINHIDDAINSVINAVKASFTPERADDDDLGKITATTVTAASTTTPSTTSMSIYNLPTITTTIATILPITTMPITTATIMPNIIGTAPAITTANFLPIFTTSNITSTVISGGTTTTTQLPLAPIIPIKRRGRSKAVDHTIAAPIMPLSVTAADLGATTLSNIDIEEHLIPATTILTNNSNTSANNFNNKIKTKTRANVALIENIKESPPITKTTISQIIEIDEKSNEISKTLPTTIAAVIPIITAIEEQPQEQKEMPEVEIIKIDEEKTSTAITNEKELENVGDEPQPAQKKFRRRRKNELAAIVADQLLESFKIDKARRDSLKKLENLAYEHKNEDLFMTGMLLMSSTKRSVTMNTAQKQQQQQQQQSAEVEPTSKRTSLRSRRTSCSNNNNNNNTNDLVAPVAKRGRRAGGGVGGGGRRTYRRRGKTLDNENISKLKSSLESFSIGIERQLTEFEAKKEQQRLNEGKESPVHNNNKTIPTKPSILRPSILSASLDIPSAPLTAENVAKITSSLAKDCSSRSAFACRDPRLNKNIHKETGEETQMKQTHEMSNICDYEEEDNYLTEIAKNVNEKIMSAENEDFIFGNDGLMQLEDTSSQFYSRPPTAMSVRSAPNFDDRSDFGTDEEHTNTEVMDMDLDDEMSVYTSYSQDIGGFGGGRKRRRRRRSILLTRRPKKRIQRNENETEKFECTLCKKIFFSANSLSKHNMTLAHVSKVSEQEYLLSRAASLEQDVAAVLSEFPSLPKPTTTRRAKTPTPTSRRAKTPTPATSRGRKSQAKTLEDLVPYKPTLSCLLQDKEQEANKKKPNSLLPSQEVGIGTASSQAHIGLNSDERLFFECCTILKGTQENDENITHKHDDSNNFSPYQYHLNNKIMAQSMKTDLNAGKINNVECTAARSNKKHAKSITTFRDPTKYIKTDK